MGGAGRGWRGVWVARECGACAVHTQSTCGATLQHTRGRGRCMHATARAVPAGARATSSGLPISPYISLACRSTCHISCASEV